MNIQEWVRSVIAIETEKRRLTILQYLHASSRYEAAASLLRYHCAEKGVPSTSDQIVAAMLWLSEQSLITTRMNGDEPIGRLTMDGREVADGTRTVPGVLRPDP